jgi:hypothetical protein
LVAWYSPSPGAGVSSACLRRAVRQTGYAITGMRLPTASGGVRGVALAKNKRPTALLGKAGHRSESSSPRPPYQLKHRHPGHLLIILLLPERDPQIACAGAGVVLTLLPVILPDLVVDSVLVFEGRYPRAGVVAFTPATQERAGGPPFMVGFSPFIASIPPHHKWWGTQVDSAWVAHDSKSPLRPIHLSHSRTVRYPGPF